MKSILSAALGVLMFSGVACAAPDIRVTDAIDSGGIIVAAAGKAAAVAVDPKDYTVVSVAAGLFADDVQRVAGVRPEITADPATAAIVVGTLGHSALVDRLAAEGKLVALDQIKGRWETTLWQIVEHPFGARGPARALVIIGSDRRGTAYGLMQLSERMGVSPWHWWADVPVPHRDTVAVNVSSPQVDAPAVKYRGIFINDEDWGLFPWAAQTFDPQFGNIGPKTYAKVFELLLRLRLNYLWPAMHACSAEFASQPENITLADRYGIVAGSSHCEPMLCNNVHWDEKTQGKWDYTLNRDAIHAYWADSARTRGAEEAVWTLGIRGIHDRAMEGPRDIPTRINIVSDVIRDQRALLGQYVSREWGPVAQAFVPYKEVLPIYDAGLKVPDDVTLVWVDDNFGYIRRLSAPAERQRSGGAGVYWHLSYYGGPHSYTWINTTAPALMWEELHKAWANDARRLWVINVGDIKPGEVGIDFFARFAWDAEHFGADAQPAFLQDFAARTFGDKLAPSVASLLGTYYRLGTMRKPELMTREWALSLPDAETARLQTDYQALVRETETLGGAVDPRSRDAFFELIGFPAQVLGKTGLIFLADRDAQLGRKAAESQSTITQLRDELESLVAQYNTGILGGKWNHMMPGLVTGKDLMAWSSQVRWPWGDKPANLVKIERERAKQPPADQVWRDAATANEQTGAGTSHWNAVPGLGTSGRALVITPAGLESSWKLEDTSAPTLTYAFETRGGDASAFIDFLPTFRLYPGMKARVVVSVDDQTPITIEVPGSSGAEDEVGKIRATAVQDNYARTRLPLPALTAGKHRFKIRAVDPGVVIDRVSLP